MYGAAIGDFIGSRFEHADEKTRVFDLMHPDCQFTDDTVCTVAVADALMARAEPAAVLRRWCSAYPDAGYGGMFIRWVADDRMEPYGSWGNGAAMRVSPAGFLARSIEEAEKFADRVTEVTHNHPEAFRGARATASAVWAARSGWSAVDIRAMVTERYYYDLSRMVDEIAVDYEFDVSCLGTVPPALTCSLEAEDFEGAIRNAISLGGDSDTIAAIAGGLAEALFRIPDRILLPVRDALPTDLREVLDRLYDRQHD